MLDFAYDEVRSAGQRYFGTEHVLLGLLREGKDAAYETLRSASVEIEGVRREIENKYREDQQKGQTP